MSAFLLDPSETLAEASIWADENRRKLPRTAPWHYVDAPLDEPRYDAKWSAGDPKKCCVVRHLSLRHYVRARELKSAGMDWTEVLASDAENPRARLAAELLESPARGSTAARVRAFIDHGRGCRATFFYYRRYLLK